MWRREEFPRPHTPGAKMANQTRSDQTSGQRPPVFTSRTMVNMPCSPAHSRGSTWPTWSPGKGFLDSTKVPVPLKSPQTEVSSRP